MEENNLKGFALTDPKAGVSKLGPTTPEEKKELGNCVICQAPTTKRCQACTASTFAPFYCGKLHQQEDWARHKLSCLNKKKNSETARVKPKRPIDFLSDCIVDDCLPAVNSPAYNTFGFSKCATESDEASLLGLYVGLIKGLGTDLDLVDEAARKGKLAELICEQYETLRPDPATRGAYYAWFVKNKSLVQ